jgi:hypothetical protein
MAMIRRYAGEAILAVACAVLVVFVMKGGERAGGRDSRPGRRGESWSETDARARAVEQWRRLPRALGPTDGFAAGAGALASPSPGAVSGTIWTAIGPGRIDEPDCCYAGVAFQANGRVNSIAVDPDNASTLYLGSAGGGVWRSDDGGSTWRPLTDQQISLGIGSSHAIAVDPNHPNTIYAGTSNFALLAQSQPRPFDLSQSKGILKSVDGGASWVVLGSGVPSGNTGNALATFSNTDINTIIVDPADSNRLYAAAGRSVPGGLYRSLDGGSTWTQAPSGSGFAESLALDTSSPLATRVLYAGLNGTGVLKSSDGGQSWVPVLTGATPAVASAGAGTFGKVIVALAPTASPPNPAGQVIYVTLFVGSQGFVFENTNGGSSASWVQKNAQVIGPSSPDFLTLGGSAFSDMVVDPASPGDGVSDVLYWGGFSQYVSTDSGATFTEIGQIHGTHGDAQTFLVVPNPSGPSIVYAGDDGGIWKSEDQGATWTGTNQPGSDPTVNAGGLQIATLYALAVKQDAGASVTIGGAQDSGMLRSTGGIVWTGTSNDGIDVVFDQVAAGTAYSVQNGCGGDCLLKSTDSGGSWFDITPATIPVGQRATFRNRLAVDPSQAGYLYVGGSAGGVFQTIDGGATFRSLGTPAPGMYVSALDVAPTSSTNLVIAANNPFVAAGSVPNKVFVTTNALAATVTFVDVTRNLPTRFVTRVAFDPNDATVIYATLAGFGTSTPGSPGHVFRTTIGGSVWTDISPAVDIPVNALALDGTSSPTDLYIGTDLGVLRGSPAGGPSWVVIDDLHLPNAAVSDLELNLQAGVLRAATWGRGVFELASPNGPAVALAPLALEFGETCAVTGANRTLDVANVGTAPLTVDSVGRVAGSTDFTVVPPPSTPLSIAAGGHVGFTAHFTPASAGSQSALLQVRSNDPGAAIVDVPATGALETTPPTLVCPVPVTVECTGPAGASASFSATATDNCAVASIGCPASGSTFPLGTTPVSCSATDTAGNVSTCSSSVHVVDSTPPVITAVAASPDTLWPPDHRMVPVSLSVSVTDVCDPAVTATCHVTGVTSNEPIAGPGGGHGPPDWEITGALTVNLRAERAGGGSGRVYRLTVQCTDASGNATTGFATVAVPHDRGRR